MGELPTEAEMRPGAEAAMARVNAVMDRVRKFNEFERAMFGALLCGMQFKLDYDKLARSPSGRAFAMEERR